MIVRVVTRWVNTLRMMNAVRRFGLPIIAHCPYGRIGARPSTIGAVLLLLPLLVLSILPPRRLDLLSLALDLLRRLPPHLSNLRLRQDQYLNSRTI